MAGEKTYNLRELVKVERENQAILKDVLKTQKEILKALKGKAPKKEKADPKEKAE